MLSERFYSFLNFLLPISSFIGTLPFKWNPHTRCFIHSRKARRKYQLHTLILSSNIIAFASMSIVYRGTGDVVSMTFLLVSVCSMILQLYWIITFNTREIMLWTNQVQHYLHHINRRYLTHYDPQREMRSKLFDLGGLLVLLCSLGAFFITSLAILIFPRTPVFWGYYLPETWPLILKIPTFYIYPIYITFMLIMAVFLMVELSLVYGFLVVPFFVKEFRLKNATRSGDDADVQLETGDSGKGQKRLLLTEPATLILAYRSLQILHEGGLQIYGIALVPTQTIITNMAMVATLVILKDGKNMQLQNVVMLATWALLSAMFWSMVLFVGGHLHFHGVKVLRSWKSYKWKSRRDAKLMGKFAKSCKPLTMHYKKYYVMRKVSMLHFIKSLSRGIMRVLLTM